MGSYSQVGIIYKPSMNNDLSRNLHTPAGRNLPICNYYIITTCMVMMDGELLGCGK